MILGIKLKKIHLMKIWAGSSLFFIVLLIIFHFSPQTEMAVLTLGALTYVILAFLHHLKERDLSFEVMLEYVLIAILVLIIFQSLIF